MRRAKVEDPTSAAPLAIGELLKPEAFPHAIERIELRETHISWVVLTGPYAYKIKKPVKLDFIDASTLQSRLHYCQEELRLNGRLAPQLYLDVVAITRAGEQVRVGGDGRIIDYAVRMQQFAASQELPALLANNEVSGAEVVALGESLARFHLSAAVAAATRTPEKTEQMYDAVLGNLAQLITHLGPVEPSLGLGRLVDWTHDCAHDLQPVFEQRERSGFVRECHGDLHAANIVRSQGKLVPFDCLEFDPKLRWIDVISDIGFLVMDLASHQRNDLAYILLSRYLEVSGDYHGVGVLPFYAVYRALVRAKVDALSAEQIPARAAEFRHRLQQRIRAALSWATPRHPLLVLMHGASGSGKSWMSERLVPELHAVRIRSDLERKRLAGVTPEQHARAGIRKGIYSPEVSHRTYGHLVDCAERCLRAGINAIVDATFLEHNDRALFHGLAARLGVPRLVVSCQADPIALAARILDRQGRADPSDANLSVLHTQLREVQPFAADEAACVITVDTSEPDAVRRVAAAVAARCSI